MPRTDLNQGNRGSFETQPADSSGSNYFSMQSQMVIPEQRVDNGGDTEPADTKTDSGVDIGGETVIADRGGEAGKSFHPIVGWLVCTGGNDRGRAFELHDGDNYIGRDGGSSSHDINLSDNTVSRDGAADMYYVRQSRTFIISRVAGTRTECMFNNKPIINGQQEMKRYDRISIGKTDLMLIPLCSEEFDWEDAPGSDKYEF